MDKKQLIVNKLLLSASVIALGISAPSFTAYAATCTGSQSRTVECRNHLGVTIGEDICNAFTTRIGERPDTTPQTCTYYCPPPPPVYNGDGDGSNDSGQVSHDTDGNGLTDTPGPGPGEKDGSPEESSPGDGDGGGSVLCGHFYQQDAFSHSVYLGDLEFAKTNFDRTTQRGYRFWAVPLTKYLNKHPDGIANKIMHPIVVSWAQEMAYRSGYHDKGHWLGKLQLTFSKPIINLVGLFVKDKDWSHLTSEQAIGIQKNQFQSDPTAILNA